MSAFFVGANRQLDRKGSGVPFAVRRKKIQLVENSFLEKLVFFRFMVTADALDFARCNGVPMTCMGFTFKLPHFSINGRIYPRIPSPFPKVPPLSMRGKDVYMIQLLLSTKLHDPNPLSVFDT